MRRYREMGVAGALATGIGWDIVSMGGYEVQAREEGAMELGHTYVQQRDGNWYVGDSRVEVYSVIAAWLQGFSPEEVQTSFPVLSPTEVYGTILYYLEHRDELDAFFRQMDALYQTRKAEAEARDPRFHEMMRQRFAAFRAAQEQHEKAQDTAAS
jgi:uncharacterized protein (DUF433 family)